MLIADQVTQQKTEPAVVVFDCDEAYLYGRDPDGRIDYSETVPWPADWPPWITDRWLRARGIPWTTA